MFPSLQTPPSVLRPTWRGVLWCGPWRLEMERWGWRALANQNLWHSVTRALSYSKFSSVSGGIPPFSSFISLFSAHLTRPGLDQSILRETLLTNTHLLLLVATSTSVCNCLKHPLEGCMPDVLDTVSSSVLRNMNRGRETVEQSKATLQILTLSKAFRLFRIHCIFNQCTTTQMLLVLWKSVPSVAPMLLYLSLCCVLSAGNGRQWHSGLCLPDHKGVNLRAEGAALSDCKAHKQHKDTRSTVVCCS